mmetsp:Transcript_14501/g.31029  ORF Transcript_14501/g.31029 Transcript_14501/m.31029 type:complete len:225 (+) Transcript_14501:262-936(+)
MASLGSGVLLDEADEVSLAAVTLVRNDLAALPSLLEIEGWEALHNVRLVANIIGSRIHLGEHKAGGALVVLCNLVPNGLELFAMATPRRVKLDKDIRAALIHHLLEGFAHHHLHGLCVGFGDLLTLPVGLYLARRKVLEPAGEGGGVDLLREVLEVGIGVVYHHCRHGRPRQSEELECTLIGISVSLHEQDLANMQGGRLFKCSLHFIGAGTLVVCKHNCLGDW